MVKKIALIGGPDIKKYTVADKLWLNISKHSKVKFTFEVVPILNNKKLHEFLNMFINDEDYIGFNVALPWKNEVARLIGHAQAINTVYKKGGKICGINTDVIGVQKAIKINKSNIKNILILGAGGAGYSTALYYSKIKGTLVSIYDISKIKKKQPSTINVLGSINDILGSKYDLIINATPLGKYHYSLIKEFSTPLDINILRKISCSKTIFFEMNYLPRETLFLQLGKTVGGKIVPGVYMLVYQAVESYSKYFRKTLLPKHVNKVIDNMLEYIEEKEIQILKSKVL